MCSFGRRDFISELKSKIVFIQPLKSLLILLAMLPITNKIDIYNQQSDAELLLTLRVTVTIISR